MVMTMAVTVGEEFDGISEIYDSTRQAATEAELRAVSSELRGCCTILDVGVGTGRFAKPLSDLGFEIVGIDLSRKMMLKARQKGVRNLIMADARNMPFKDGAFDASIIIHVLHLLPDWLSVAREMGRVTKNKVAALLSNRQGEWSNASNFSVNSASPDFSQLWVRYTQLREEMGYPIKRNKRMWHNETEIRAKLPPMKLIQVSDEVIVTKVSDLIKRFQQRSYSLQQHIPKDMHYKIIQKLLGPTESADSTGKEAPSALHEKQVTRRIIEELAVWRPDQLSSG
jgi:ubiquinone/menaquinone biosynthesis C-methylase UbiE